MKPSWDDAPPWAKWLAMDETGMWRWHENKPTRFAGFWNCHGLNRVANSALPKWDKTREARPNAKSN